MARRFHVCAQHKYSREMVRFSAPGSWEGMDPAEILRRSGYDPDEWRLSTDLNRPDANVIGLLSRLPGITSHTTELVFYRETRGLGDAIMLESCIHDVTLQAAEALGRPLSVSIYCAPSVMCVYDHHPLSPTVRAIAEFDIGGYKGRDDVALFDVSTACADYETRFMHRIDMGRPQIWTEHCGFEFRKRPPRLYLSDACKARAREYAKHHIPRFPCIGVGYRSIERWRDYPYMNTLVTMLADDIGGTVVVFDNQRISAVFPENVWVETGVTTRDLIRAISLVDIMVTVDTAQAHIAGALGRPIYGIFGPTDPRIRLDDYGVPWDSPPPFTACGRQPCWYKPCEDRWCMKTLHPKQIVRRVAAMMREGGLDVG